MSGPLRIAGGLTPFPTPQSSLSAGLNLPALSAELNARIVLILHSRITT